MLEKLAMGSELVVERHSRWMALVPPIGVGQFGQNGQTTDGWLFPVGESPGRAPPSSPPGSLVFYESQGLRGSVEPQRELGEHVLQAREHVGHHR